MMIINGFYLQGSVLHGHDLDCERLFLHRGLPERGEPRGQHVPQLQPPLPHRAPLRLHRAVLDRFVVEEIQNIFLRRTYFFRQIYI